jgi:hypothetical protein
MRAFRFTAGATMKRDPSKDSALDPDPHLLTRRLRLAIAGLQVRDVPRRQVVLIVAKGVEVGDRGSIAEDGNNEGEQQARRRVPPPMNSVSLEHRLADYPTRAEIPSICDAYSYPADGSVATRFLKYPSALLVPSRKSL